MVFTPVWLLRASMAFTLVLLLRVCMAFIAGCCLQAFEGMHRTIASLNQMLTLGEKVSISESYTITITDVELRKLQSMMKRLGVHSDDAVLSCLLLCVCRVSCIWCHASVVIFLDVVCLSLLSLDDASIIGPLMLIISTILSRCCCVCACQACMMCVPQAYTNSFLS